MAAKPCLGCGVVPGWTTAGGGSLSAMELYHHTGISIDAGGYLVL